MSLEYLQKSHFTLRRVAKNPFFFFNMGSPIDKKSRKTFRRKSDRLNLKKSQIQNKI